MNGEISIIPDIGTEPISPDSPAGEDARYEPEYEVIQSEIEKMASPTSEGVTDWAKIVELGTELLSRKSKNLLIAGYLFVGLLQSRGPGQLAPAMAMYRGMIENFWDDLFPPKKRKKARINAIEWWLEKVQAELDGFPEGFEMEAEPHAAMMADLAAIDDFLAENLDSTPLLHQLRSRLDAIPAVQPPEPEPEPEPEADSEDAYIALQNFGNSSIDIEFWGFVRVFSYDEQIRIRHSLVGDIIDMAEEIGVSFAFPTRTVHMLNAPPDFELPAKELSPPETEETPDLPEPPFPSQSRRKVAA